MFKKSFFLYLVLLCCLVTQVTGQCLEISTNEKLKICSSEQKTLAASTNGTVLFSEWTPTKGLNNPLSLNSPITEPFDTTYTLRVRGFLESENLLANSDFSEGNKGFTSEYEYESTKPGGYIIGTVGTELFADAKACEDHTTPEAGGNMMMVRVSESTNLDIYCQEINVSQNQDYHFKSFATGLVLNSPPVVVLKINDEVISIGTLGSFACSWQQVSGNWNAGNATTAKICLSVSQEDIGAGTDFVLDDMGFYKVCEIEKKVEVEVLDFTLTIDETADLPCGDSIQLNADVQPGDIYFISDWTTSNGNIIQGKQSLSPTINKAGAYEIEVITTIDEQTCQTNATIEVINVSNDTLSIASSGNIHCQQTEITLEAIDMVSRTDFSYEWISADGHVLAEKTKPTIQVTQPGLYQLQRTDLVGDCPLIVEIEVLETSLKDFSFALSLPDCDTPFGTILFNELSGGMPPFSFSIDNGNRFLPDRVFPNLMGGTYDLIVQDANECEISKTTNFVAFTGIQLALPNEVRIDKRSTFQLPLAINLADSLIESIEWSPAIGLSCTDCQQPFFTNNNPQNYHCLLYTSPSPRD